MEEFVHKLGVDWRLLLSQAVNFLILLVALRAFAYKPILKILNERRKKIDEGLTKAKEADERLHEVSTLTKEKLKEAEQKSLVMLRETEKKSKLLEEKMMGEAKKKEEEVIKNAERAAEAKKEEARHEMEQEAAHLIREAIIKTVEMKPDAIDETLIQKAIEGFKKTQ